MWNPFKRQPARYVEVGQKLCSCVNHYSDDEVSAEAMKDIALEVFRKYRKIVDANETYDAREAESTKLELARMRRVNVELKDEIDFLTRRINNLKQLAVKHCDKKGQ